MRKILYSIAVLSALIASITAKSAAEWKQRSIYQLLTDRFAKGNGDTSGCDLHNYCGGDFDGVTKKLQYIKNLGFNAIWISPVVDNMDGGYHGYWAANWEKINNHFGDENSLKRLVSTAHSMDIWVMVDVVANHVAPVGNDFSRIYPLNKAEHYHPNCDINDWNNQNQVENCRLAGLPDLNQGNSYVRQYLKNWISNLVQTYGFDGIRIDTVPEVPKDFWTEYGQAAGVFQIGENFNGNSQYVGPYQNYLTSLLNYPMYFTIKDVFMGTQSMNKIRDRYNEEQNAFKDVEALGIFVDNHDNARFLNQHQNQQHYKSALAFSLTAKGIPIFYYGSEQNFNGGNDPYNREVMWNSFNENSETFKFIQTIMKYRTKQQSFNNAYAEKWTDDTFYAFTRGQFLVALTNQANGNQQRTVPNTGLSGTVCNIFNQGDCQQVNSGSINISLTNGEVKIYVPQGSLMTSEETLFLSE